MADVPLPSYLTMKDGKARDSQGRLYEVFEGKWCEVKDGGRYGWWRFHEHYDRNGYCDNPARGY